MPSISKFSITFLCLFAIRSVSFGQDVITYKVLSIEKSNDNKSWKEIPFSHCIISQDIKNFITTIYNGTSKIIYSGYDVDLPKDDPKNGTIYVTKHIDNFGKECTIEQIIWNGTLKGSSTFFFLYNGLTYKYQTDIIEPQQIDQ